MPVARYFLFVGGVLLALLFVINAIVPQETVVAAVTNPSAPSFDRSTVRIRSTQKLPERVVYDTSLPTVVPPQVNVVAAAAPAAARETSAQARVRDTFAQFIPAEAKNDVKTDARGKPAVAEAKPLEQQAQLQPVQAPKKRKVAKTHTNPPTQLQPTRLAQPGPFQPFRVAQQQPRSGLFSGFGTW
ncbi:hypothetical protein UP10_01390 [Bradyrhizobium sp. LTSPM299]|uniref:hypothetical protein n=1 Tax=Bradyrhizobium sp. LTSPM299 TaxID=1619233 RepID=UPI0005C95710|nr:hypothetical protein [Bradyrhizobium sp. LTSPM299]KJC62069.1 hypothetical protein UP10_01390 [Bradyrhizobium sp. LTSPM299]